MKSTDPTKSDDVAGELVLQNGRQAGTRRPLGAPTTFIGRSQACDIRLNVDGIDGMHCVLVFAADGLHARDLNSSHGTYVNGERVDTTLIRHGDVLKVGPFQFRVELSPTGSIDRPISAVEPGGDLREAIQVQVAAVVAQQIALEEEEARLMQRQSDMHQQEEQLAAHLAEKQEQVQMWTEHTKSERMALRKQKVEQHQALSQLEQELNAAKQQLGEEQARLNDERERINKVYQRLRDRWQKQWSAEKEKYQHLFARLETGTKTLAARHAELSEQEAKLTQERTTFNTEREASSRQLQEAWDELKKAQAAWRRRHTQERTLWKSREQEVEEAVRQMMETRQALQQEREAWKKQQDAMQKELYGLNNRVVHQREKIKEQEERMATLDAELRTRLLHMRRLTDIEGGPKDETTAAILAEAAAPPIPTPAPDRPAVDLAEEVARIEALDQLAGELADQRVHLVEQYKRLAEIQELWTLQREQAADELDAVAQKLREQEQALAEREERAVGTAQGLTQEREEIQAVRREIQAWRGRLKAREQMVEQDHQQKLLTFHQQETMLQEQLAGLTQLRQRWNRRRQDEIEYVRSEQAELKQQREEASRLRHELLAKGEHLDEEKRIVAEKAIAVELYRQEVAHKSHDPGADRRIERLRRRWLMQNTVVIRDAKHEREIVKAEMVQLEARTGEWLKQMEAVTQADAILAEKLSVLEEREALLKSRELKVEQEGKRHEALRREAEEKLRAMKNEVERMAIVVDEEKATPVWSANKAA